MYALDWRAFFRYPVVRFFPKLGPPPPGEAAKRPGGRPAIGMETQKVRSVFGENLPGAYIWILQFHLYLKQKAPGVIPTRKVSTAVACGVKRYTTPGCT